MNIGAILAVICGVIIISLTGWGLAAMLRRYLEVSPGKARWILLFSVLAGVGAGIIRNQGDIDSPLIRWGGSQEGEVLACLGAGLLAAAALVFVVKLHSKWIAGHLTDAEKKPGLEGSRAWLGADNIVCVVLLSLLAWLAFDYSPGGVAMLGLLALLTYPGLVSVSVYLQAPPPTEANATERQRVLSMLDSGKITASECAELLSALNYAEKPRAAKGEAGPRKLALIGALLLLIGFFLPWFSFNPQSELNHMARGLPIDPNWTQHFPWGLSSAANTLRISGGDVQHGLGWLVLLLGLAAAALPYLAGDLNEQTRQRATLAGLGAGAIILLYLVTQNLRFVSIGIFLALIGYGLQLAGALRGGRFGAHGAD